MVRCEHTRRRWVLSALGQDLVIVAALLLLVATRPSSALTSALSIAIPLVLAWGAITLHFPRAVELTEEAIEIHGYGRTHRFRWCDVSTVRVRRFLVRDRVLVRILPSPPWRGRYWLLDSMEGWSAVVAALESRAIKSRDAA
jgi:hypothetical protein